ncbi:MULTISPECIES: GTP-binding protein [unclassified Methanoculleus]|uniref:GTP-binding protein n=1 Tax=unclassified Methanoculleus TaxID=2619537 RepID=UPI0025E5DA5E|nr:MULTISPECIES: GTP-binding protein [unclassified Methanoculleus]MCK9318357.1 GTP-binding protein [Methanoculleus sp.]MDD2253261.1 GTP-binding protein [Methanoculleus sp.]MDD2787156.1 GTP-binding protein [Methanoculleus sp.]MDD3215501.1 GTP-binding protein [Methanoculleus sp.]MDD4313225.1 GTP-binding protein [Methanoculleus sp.]
MAEGRLKIVVFGSFNAGKSSFIQALDPRSRHIEATSNEGSTTVAFDFGRLQVRDRAVYLFGTPGQDRFEFVRQVLSRGMDGAIIVVDATTGVDATTQHLYDSLKSLNVPLAFMANKCDSPGAVPEAIRRVLPGEAVHFISARNGENVHAALDAFVATLTAR